jgi:PLD-like domain
VEAGREGKSIQLLGGLNVITTPIALRAVFGIPNVSVRYLTGRFHAKIYLFDAVGMVGSANLTDGGMFSNREVVVVFDRAEDSDTIDEVRALFLELWESGRVLTKESLDLFERTWKSLKPLVPDPHTVIEDAIGQAEPPNIAVDSRNKTPERVFLEDLRRRVYEEYRAAFSEVTELLIKHKIGRPELAGIGPANETNRFLNWVRLTQAIGEEAWQSAPPRSQEERKTLLLSLGDGWMAAQDSLVPFEYVQGLSAINAVFGSRIAITNASKEQMTEGLMAIYAFSEQSRFVKGGAVNLPAAFWSGNPDGQKVKRTMTYLLHEQSDFIQRLHDVLYDRDLKLQLFGLFCSLELFGCLHPLECPPMNGRMAKALRYLGFNVRGA